MSVYSGFATRKLEESYNKILVSLIKVLQRRIVKFYRQEEIKEDVFKGIIKEQTQKLGLMEQQKYNEPYYSQYLNELCEQLGVGKPEITKTVFVTTSEPQPSNLSSSRKNTALSSRKNSAQMREPKTQVQKQQKFIQDISAPKQSPYIPPQPNNFMRTIKSGQRNRSFNISIADKPPQPYTPLRYQSFNRRFTQKNHHSIANPNESLEEKTTHTSYNNKSKQIFLQ